MYKHNTEVCSCNHCCSGKAISITYPVCVFVALGIQHTTHTCHIVICGQPGSIMFFHLFHKLHNLKKKKILHIKYVFLVSLELLSEKSSF
jgi:hypothetical protein